MLAQTIKSFICIENIIVVWTTATLCEGQF